MNTERLTKLADEGYAQALPRLFLESKRKGALTALAEALDYDVHTFVEGYTKALLWTSTDERDTPLDEHYDTGDLSEAATDQVFEDCLQFIAENYEAVRQYEALGHGPESAGHDFWLTRNGHGAGFWDRGAGALGEALSKQSRLWGEAFAYVVEERVEVS